MNLNVFWHPDVLLHDTGTGVFEAAGSDLLSIQEKHPEGTDRITNMLSILKRGPLSPRLIWHWGRHASEEELSLFHTPKYISEIRNSGNMGVRRLTSTTLVSPGSFNACCAAAGTTLQAMSFVMEGENRIAYALVRPPGHHASRNQADGYCIFNNIAIATEFALKNGVKRIAIIDWDVHHGNGTQEGFYKQEDVLTISMHMDHGAWGPSHTQTGDVNEIGREAGKGFNLNIPLPMGTGSFGYDFAMKEIVIPAIKTYQPEILIIACGQDASQFDPNGRQLVSMEGFRRMGVQVRELCDKYSNGKLLLVQEGGYAVSYAAFCLHATLSGVLGLECQLPDPLAYLTENQESARKDVACIKSKYKAIIRKK
jgi:acetoin utilization deacetylase AcuC-like enzyme